MEISKSAAAIWMVQKGGFFLPSTHKLTPSILRKNTQTKIRSKHSPSSCFFLSFFLLLLPHLTHAWFFSFLFSPSSSPSPHACLGFFFFFSSSSSSPSPHTRMVFFFFFFFFFFFSLTSLATHHFWPNHLQRISSFPAKPNQKTPKNSNPTSKIDYNTTKFVSNASKLKPRWEG
jgi:hypothetical protein